MPAAVSWLLTGCSEGHEIFVATTENAVQIQYIHPSGPCPPDHNPLKRMNSHLKYAAAALKYHCVDNSLGLVCTYIPHSQGTLPGRACESSLSQGTLPGRTCESSLSANIEYT